MSITTASFASLADLAVDFVPPSAADLGDAELIEAQRTLAQIRRRVDAAAAVISGEIQRRSRPELGYDGLAQRLGARTSQRLVQQVTGVTAREATALVRAGTLIETANEPTGPVWLRAVSEALAAGRISIDAVDAIRTGLRQPDEHVTAEQLRDAATELLRSAPWMTVERLAATARDLRANLDLERVADAEAALRQRRYLHLIPQADGMTRISGLLDPESAAIVTAAYDAATSPRRGGPRFVDPDAQAAADRVLNDPRSTEQIALDDFVELIRIGMNADNTLPGPDHTIVNLHVTVADLDRRTGIARYEGQTAPISIQSAQRQLCNAALVPILFDGDGHPLNVGREQRRFNRRQRRALAARDGGCRFPGCQRPPSWTEAHHIDEWQHGGHTDIANGILLCRHHHLLIHNNHWRIIRNGTNYYVVAPADIDPQQTPILAPAKGAAYRAAG